MPIRDYRCANCGYVEKDVFFRRENEVELPAMCPECNKDDGWELMLPDIAVQFKGSGFYETDYKKKK